MTLELWRACLLRFQNHGTHNEQMMANLLLRLIQIEDPMIRRLLDAYASEILEMAP